VPVDVSTGIIIALPRERVADFAGDPSNAPRWQAGVLDVEWANRPPLREGTRLRVVARLLGRTLRFTFQVTDFVPRARLVVRAVRGPFPAQASYAWEALDPRRTRMVLRVHAEPRGPAGWWAAAVRRTLGRDLARLRALLEAHG